VVDNLSTGNAWAVSGGAVCIVAEIQNTCLLAKIMQEHRVQTVVHLAAKSSVPQSFIEPECYYAANVDGTRSVLEACSIAGVQRFVFSSTAAVYGNATHGLVKEDAPLQPISPYGVSKLEAETQVSAWCDSHGISYMIFRFFNVIGAHPDGDLGQYNPSASHLLKKCIDCSRDHSILDVYGRDYATIDGTAERDYIHVQDLASVLACSLDYLEQGNKSFLLNAGYGSSCSVLAFIRTFRRVTGYDLRYQYLERREGDPASLIADVTLLQRTMNWSPAYNAIETMIASSWSWVSVLQQRGVL